MRPRFVTSFGILASLVCSLLYGLAYSQTEPPKPEPPPDQKAYVAADGLKDNAAKIAALRKFTIDFPKSSRKDNAEFGIFTTLIKIDPTKRRAILKQAALVIKASTKEDRPEWANEIAQKLATETIFYAEAERYLSQSPAFSSEEAYARQISEGYTKAKITPPTASEIHGLFRDQYSAGQLTLAEIYEREGKLQQAETSLKNIAETFSFDARLWFVYGTVEEKLGHLQQANDFYTKAFAMGLTDARPKVESMYKASHNGTLSGLDSTLDETYRRAFPNPVSPGSYVPSSQRTERVVLAELFTGAGCGPCIAADLAFDAAAVRFSRKEVAIVIYHGHSPLPDPLTIAAGVARAKMYGVKGTPTFAIDGDPSIGSGGPRSFANRSWNMIDTGIEKELDTPPQAKVMLEATRKDNLVKINASFEKFASAPPDSKLFLVLVEDDVRYVGQNGIRFHNMVARAISEDGQTTFDLDAITAANRKELDAFEKHSDRFGTTTFRDKPVAMDVAHLGVVAFVQDTTSKKVLQAAYRSLQPDMRSAASE